MDKRKQKSKQHFWGCPGILPNKTRHIAPSIFHIKYQFYKNSNAFKKESSVIS